LKLHKEKYICCGCGDLSHLMRITYFFWRDAKDNSIVDVDLYCDMFLNPNHGFWLRAWRGLRYIFGFGNHNQYESVMLDEKKAQEIIDFLEEYKKDKSIFEKEICT